MLKAEKGANFFQELEYFEKELLEGRVKNYAVMILHA